MSLRQNLKDKLGRAKDKGLSRAFAAFLRQVIEPYGELVDFELDSQARTVEALVMPDGEAEGVRFTLEAYEFVQRGGRHYLRLGPVLASRPWIETLVNDILDKALDTEDHGRKIDITDLPLAKALSGLL